MAQSEVVAGEIRQNVSHLHCSEEEKEEEEERKKRKVNGFFERILFPFAEAAIRTIGQWELRQLQLRLTY